MEGSWAFCHVTRAQQILTGCRVWRSHRVEAFNRFTVQLISRM